MDRKRLTAAGLSALAGTLALGGCGWTARDEFLARQASIKPRPGDGSELISRAPEDPFRAAEGRPVVRSADGIER